MAKILEKGNVTIELTQEEYEALVELLANMSQNDMKEFLVEPYADEKAGSLTQIYMDISQGKVWQRVESKQISIAIRVGADDSFQVSLATVKSVETWHSGTGSCRKHQYGAERFDSSPLSKLTLSQCYKPNSYKEK